MPLYGSVGPPTGAPPLQGDPFKNYSNAGISMSKDPAAKTSDGLYVAQVIPDIEHPDNVQNFSSGAIGNPSAEQIWAFKMRQLAADIDLMNALVGNMQHTVPPGRDAWRDGIKSLVGEMTQIVNAAGTLCEATANPNP